MENSTNQCSDSATPINSSEIEPVRTKRKYTKRQHGPRKSYKGLKAKMGMGRIKKTDQRQLTEHMLNYFTKLTMIHSKLSFEDVTKAALISRLQALDIQKVNVRKHGLTELKDQMGIYHKGDEDQTG